MPEDYFKVKALNKTFLVKLAQSPAHAVTPEKPRDPKLLNIGSAFHCLTLEPSNFEARFAILEEGLDLRVKAGKEAKKEAEAAGKILLKWDDYQNILGMAQAVRKHPGALKLISAPGPVEQPVYCNDPEYGFKLKIKPDKLTANCMVPDLKSTTNASLAEFQKIAWNLKYHWQGFFYLWVCTLAYGVPYRDFPLIVVERDPPWGVNIFFIPNDMLLLAAKEIAPLRRLYADCLEKDKWPSYPTEPQYLEPPPWAWRQMKEIETRKETQFLLTERSEA